MLLCQSPVGVCGAFAPMPCQLPTRLRVYNNNARKVEPMDPIDSRMLQIFKQDLPIAYKAIEEEAIHDIEFPEFAQAEYEYEVDNAYDQAVEMLQEEAKTEYVKAHWSRMGYLDELYSHDSSFDDSFADFDHWVAVVTLGGGAGWAGLPQAFRREPYVYLQDPRVDHITEKANDPIPF